MITCLKTLAEGFGHLPKDPGRGLWEWLPALLMSLFSGNGCSLGWGPPRPRLGCCPTLVGPYWVRPQRQVASQSWSNTGLISVFLKSMALKAEPEGFLRSSPWRAAARVEGIPCSPDAMWLQPFLCLLFMCLIQLSPQFHEIPQCPSSEFFIKKYKDNLQLISVAGDQKNLN